MFGWTSPKDGVIVDPDIGGKNMQEVTAPSSLPIGRKRDLPSEDERPSQSHEILWTVIIATVLALVAAGVYGYRMYGSYMGKLKLLPAIQGQLAVAGQRINAAEDALRNWTSQRDAWDKRLSGVETRIGGILRTARKQAEEVAAKSQQHMEGELDQRSASLQDKMDKLQSAQQSADTRLSGFEEQLNRMQAANEQEVERLREELRQSQDAGKATMASVNHEIARIDQRSGQSASDLESIHRKVDQQRIGFELAVNHARELAPGISMDVTHTDVSHQRFDGSMWLMPDRKTVWIHGRALQEPLVVYNRGDERPREVVVTRVTKYSVIGYVLAPSENAAPAAISSTASHSPESVALLQSEGQKE
jgi:predicted  nucleic acid-binding Zn-ribbon protein